MRKMRWGALFGASLVLTACAGGDEAANQAATEAEAVPAAEAAAPAALPEGVTAEMVAQGQEIFNTSICVSCHQQNGIGGPLAPALNDGQWLNVDGSYDAIVGIIKTGVNPPKQYPAMMPPMGGAQLAEDQIRALAAYIFSISRGG